MGEWSTRMDATENEHPKHIFNAKRLKTMRFLSEKIFLLILFNEDDGKVGWKCVGKLHLFLFFAKHFLHFEAHRQRTFLIFLFAMRFLLFSSSLKIQFCCNFALLENLFLFQSFYFLWKEEISITASDVDWLSM